MLKRKAIEIFDDFNKVIESENRKSEMAKEAGQEYKPHYEQRIKLGLLEITLHSIYDLDTTEFMYQKVLEAYVDNWEYKKNRSFPHSEEGFIEACEWIDEQREKVIEELL